MTVPLTCLLAFAAWTLALVVFPIGAIRIPKVLLGRAKANDFPADEPHGSPAYGRVLRAHLNCVENLPVFGAVVVVAHLAGVGSPIFDRLALVYIAARVLQSIVHISSGSALAVTTRFHFFLAQIVCVVWMGALLVV